MAAISVPYVQDSARLDTGTARTRVNASAEDMGAAVGRGLIDVAKGVDALGIAAEREDQRRDEADVNALDVAYTQFERDQLHNPENGYFAKQGKNAMDDREPLKARINERIAVLAQGARSERSRKAFTDLATKRSIDTFSRADSYAQDQFRIYEDQTFEARAGEAGESLIAGFLDPGARDKSEATLRSILDNIAARKGLSPEAKDALVKGKVGAAYFDAIALQISNNPYETKKQLTREGGWGDKLDAEQKARLLQATQAEIDRRRAKWEASVRDTVGNQIELLKMGIPVRANERVGVDTVRAALGEGYAASYEMQLTAFDRGQAMLSMPSSDLQAILARPDVVPDGAEDVRAVTLDRADKVAASNVLKQRFEDPMGYLINNGLVDPKPGGMGARGGPSPKDFMSAVQAGDWNSVKATLRARQSALETVGRKVGVNELPLTGQEAAALGGALSTLPPDGQAMVLGDMAKTLGPSSRSYRGLMSQIAGQTSGTVGYAGYVSGQKRSFSDISNAQAAQALLRGQALLSPVKDAETGVKSGKFAMPSEGDLREQWADYVGGKSASQPSIYRGMPDAERASFDAFRSAYAGLASEQGVTDGKMDRGIAKKAAQIATGGAGNLFGERTALPWGMSGADVQERINRGWPKIVAAYPSLKGSKPNAYGYLTIGEGRYMLLDGASPLLDQGREVIIDVKP